MFVGDVPIMVIPGLTRDPETFWIPAFAGMTIHNNVVDGVHYGIYGREQTVPR
jgi:hypothetical protein